MILGSHLGMTMNKGFVKLHRKFLEWEWYSCPNTKTVFLHLMLTANHKPSRYQGHEVPRGAVVTGYPALAKQLNLSVRNVRTSLQHLKNTGEVTVKVTSKFSVITLVKYDFYHSDNPEVTGKVTGKRQASDRQVTTSKECKNGRSNITLLFESFWEVYPKKVGKKNCEKKWKARNLDSLGEKIIQDVKDRIQSDSKWKEGYIPNPETYINGDRWEDEISSKQEQPGDDVPWMYQRRI